MSTTLYVIVTLFVALVGLAGRAFFWGSGRRKERLKNAEKTIKDIEKSHGAINRARNDESLSERLLKKYGLKK